MLIFTLYCELNIFAICMHSAIKWGWPIARKFRFLTMSGWSRLIESQDGENFTFLADVFEANRSSARNSVSQGHEELIENVLNKALLQGWRKNGGVVKRKSSLRLKNLILKRRGHFSDKLVTSDSHLSKMCHEMLLFMVKKLEGDKLFTKSTFWVNEVTWLKKAVLNDCCCFFRN